MRELVRDRNRLEHIIDAIDRLQKGVDKKSFEDVCKDKLAYYGLVKNLEIIGEASYRLTKAFRDSHPGTPWDKIIAMRHILVHDYYNVDDETIRYVIEDDLNPLRSQIADYLMDTDWEEWVKNEKVISESAVNKNITNTAWKMLVKGYDIKEISEITGLSVEDIESL